MKSLVVLSSICLASLACLAASARGGEGPKTQPKAPDLLVLRQEIVQSFRAGKWRECAEKAKKLIELDISNYFPSYYLAACYSHLQEEKPALEWLERTLEANHPLGGELRKDRELAWILERESGKAVFQRREERIVARTQGILRHQRFQFSFPVWDDPKTSLSSSDFRRKVLAVLIVESVDDEPSSLAATALQSIREELPDRPLEIVAIHLEDPANRPRRAEKIEKYRKGSGWKEISLVGDGRRDLFPLAVDRFPAAVFIDAAGTPRFIEEGYGDAQARRYRERIDALLKEAERKPPEKAGEKGEDRPEAGGRSDAGSSKK